MQVKIEKAIEIAKNGGIIVFPTDTVYGVGVIASNKEAVKTLLSIKERTNNIPLLVSCFKEANEIFDDLPADLANLAEKHWPGGLTIVYKAKKKYFLGYDNLDTVAIRVPNNEIALNILKKTGPMAVSSANKHNDPAPKDVNEANFSDKIDFLVDGGAAMEGGADRGAANASAMVDDVDGGAAEGGAADGGVAGNNTSSTIVTYVDGKVKVLRNGAVKI